jgi:raffinose/stachyose/melibiose transport system permease protein
MGVWRYTARTFGRELALIVAAILFFIPIYFLVTLSLKSQGDIFADPNSFPTDPVLSNYTTAWQGPASISIARSLVNSLVISVGSVAGLILIGSLCAYTLARRPSKMSTLAYMGFLLGIIIPFQLGVVPIYVAMRNLHLVPSYLGMIILNIGLLMPLTVFLYTGFVRALPKEYEEAAQVDGAGLTRIFLRIVFPLLRPVTATVAVLTGMITWNEFFLPLVFLSGSNYQPLQVTIYSYVGEYVTQWNFVFAAVVIALAPALAFYLFAQRQLIRGFAGGVRG